MKVAIVHNSEEKSKQVTKQLTTLLAVSYTHLTLPTTPYV